jgi:hypothetical protein
MAIGDTDELRGWRKIIKVVEAATSKAAPTLATHGVDLGDLFKGRRPRNAAIFVASTAGSGTMTVTIKCWGYITAAATWAPCGKGSASLKGLLNNQNAIPEVSADSIVHFEPLDLPTTMDRFDVEFTAIGGTATAISVWIVIPEEP